jgi:putative transposase
MTEVTAGAEQVPGGCRLLLRELTERAWAGGLKLTGEGGLLGPLTKMVVGALWRARWTTTSATQGTTRRPQQRELAERPPAKTVLTETGRWRSRFPGSELPVSSRKSSRRGSGV